MKNIMLDHFRRWGWVLALCGGLELVLGWSIVASPTTPMEFWALLLTMWTGATLLSFDLKRGVLRALAPLPVTGRQIGRSWWLATVTIPAIALAVLLFLGAGTFYHFHPDQAVRADRLAVVSLFNLAWLGISFTMVFNATRGFGGNLREFYWNGAVSGLAILAFFGSMLLCQNAATSPVKAGVLLGLGALLTAVGWVRAEQLELGRAGLYLGRIEPPNLRRAGNRLTPLASKIAPHVPGGDGGIPFLIRTTCVRGFLQLAGMATLMAIVWRWQTQQLSSPTNLGGMVAVGSLMCAWFVLFYQFMPHLGQLRLLRTLPISTIRLAVVMIGLAVLPLITVGVLTAGVAGLALGKSAMHTVASRFTFILAPTALGVFVAVWQGAGKQAYAGLLLTLFGFWMGGMWLQTFLHYPEIPFRLAGLIAASSLLLAFLLTRRALSHSHRACRIQANPAATLPWGAGR